MHTTFTLVFCREAMTLDMKYAQGTLHIENKISLIDNFGNNHTIFSIYYGFDNYKYLDIISFIYKKLEQSYFDLSFSTAQQPIISSLFCAIVM